MIKKWQRATLMICILYLMYCNYDHIYPLTFFLHLTPDLFCHGTAFILCSLRAHLYRLAVFFSLPSANMALLSVSFWPILDCFVSGYGWRCGDTESIEADRVGAVVFKSGVWRFLQDTGTLVTSFTFLVLCTLSALCTLISPLMVIPSFMLITFSF